MFWGNQPKITRSVTTWVVVFVIHWSRGHSWYIFNPGYSAVQFCENLETNDCILNKYSKIHSSSNGFPMDFQWFSNRFSMDSEWIPGGLSLIFNRFYILREQISKFSRFPGSCFPKLWKLWKEASWELKALERSFLGLLKLLKLVVCGLFGLWNTIKTE